MLLSAVRKISNPARSAAASKSQLEVVSQPRVLASVIVWPDRKGDNGAGTLWSKRTSIGRGRLYWLNGNRSSEAASGKLQDLDYLLLGNVKPVRNLIDGGSRFEVFEHGGHGHAGIAKHPCAA